MRLMNGTNDFSGTVSVSNSALIFGDNVTLTRMGGAAIAISIYGAVITASDADTLEKVIAEMLVATTSERQGRVIDHDPTASMEKKKQEGYF